MSKFISEINEGFMNEIEAKRQKRKEQAKNVTAEDKKEFIKGMVTGSKEEQIQNRIDVGRGLVEEISMDLPGNLMWGQFMQYGSFTADKSSWFYKVRNKNLDEGGTPNVFTVRGNGNAPQKLMVQDNGLVFVYPERITSQEYAMDKFSLELGLNSDFSGIKEEAQDDIMWKLEDMNFALLENGLYDDITALDGVNIGRRVKEVPESNKLDLADQKGITLETLKAIAKHASMMGKQIEAIYTPVSGEFDIWDWAEVPQKIENVTSTDYTKGNPYEGLLVIPDDVRREIVKTGNPGQLFGRNFNITANNTLEGDPTNGDIYIWVKLSGACGHLNYYEGSGLTNEYMKEDADNIYYTLMKNIMLFQTPTDRTNYLRVRIKAQA